MVSSITPVPSQQLHPASTILWHHQDTRDVQSVLERHTATGYRPMWCNTYQSGQGSHADLIMTNRTDINATCVVEIGNKSLPRTLSRMEEWGYYLWHITTRVRGRLTFRPTFSLLLKPLPDHLEHVHYLRETEEEYLNHLANNIRRNFTLLCHSFYSLGDKFYASSVYVRDRRLALTIPIQMAPQPRWTSYYNLTFYNFTSILARLANQSVFPSTISTYQEHGSTDSQFAVVFREEPVAMGTWFTWGLNKTAADELTNTSQTGFYKPVLSLGYDYRGSEEFYLQFVRKQSNDL